MVTITSARIRTEIGRQNAMSDAIGRAQLDVSSKTRLQAASDDPLASARVANIRRTRSDEATWSANVTGASAIADRADNALDVVQLSVDRAKELMLRAGNATTSAADRTAIAAELAGIREDVAVQMRSTDTDGNPLFPEKPPLAVPVGKGLTLAASASRADAFGDIDAVLGSAIEALSVTDAAARGTAITDSLAAIDGTASRLANARGAQGVRMQRLEAAGERFAESAARLGDEDAALSGTNMPETLAFIQQTLTQLSASQTAFARVSQQTLFDLLG